VEATGVELFRVLITCKLLIPGTATTAKKAPIARSIVRLLYENAFRFGVPRAHVATSVSHRFAVMDREKHPRTAPDVLSLNHLTDS